MLEKVRITGILKIPVIKKRKVCKRHSIQHGIAGTRINHVLLYCLDTQCLKQTLCILRRQASKQILRNKQNPTLATIDYFSLLQRRLSALRIADCTMATQIMFTSNNFLIIIIRYRYQLP